MVDSMIEETCIMCPRQGAKHCPVCKNAKYCSANCQALDWLNHKIVCKTFTEDRPSKNHHRALFFPGRAERPRFVWLKRDFDDSVFFGPGGRDRSYSHRSNVQARDMNRDRDERLNIYCMEINTSQPANRAIAKFTRAGDCSTCFRGPYLVMCHASSIEQYRDISIRDVRHAADYFSTFNRGLEPDLLHTRTLAARILCPADRVGDIPDFLDSVVDDADPVFGMQGSGIANLLGMPLLVPQLMTDDLQRAQQQGLVGAHLLPEEAIFLMRDVNSRTRGSQIPAEDLAAKEKMRQVLGDQVDRMASRLDGVQDGQEGFGSSPNAWNGASGSVVIVRADGLPLPREHVEALCAYVEHEGEPRLSAAVVGLSAGQIVPEREDMLQAITKQNFLSFYHQYQQSKEARVAMALSPYAWEGVLLEQMKRVIEERHRKQEELGVPPTSSAFPRQRMQNVFRLRD